ncbi:MAG: GHKL domain-containing protein [Blautia sp.]|nr:GHKL domain-containing protein [Blautia sp.]MCM1201765.1 GHKL domain-containing protein [Bacteroides fragilis]
MDTVSYWIAAVALLGSGLIYVYTIELRIKRAGNLAFLTAAYFLGVALFGRLPVAEVFRFHVLLQIAGLLFLACFLHMGRNLSWPAAVYYAIWALMSWQLLFELCLLYQWNNEPVNGNGELFFWLGEALIFIAGHIVMALTIGRWLPEKGKKKIGPRQFSLAVLTLTAFQLMAFVPGDREKVLRDRGWLSRYLIQILLAVILYLQNELFKKSEMRKELELMTLLWKKEQEQYQISRENIALINQKCHDLKHQIYALRNIGEAERKQYLDEVAESVQIYEAMVQTGNEALDTILTEKSLYCKGKGITISCVADGGQLDFINTVDLYAILGNALDNAIEAVEKFEQQEKRQIDVLIYRKEQFLAINVINPLEEPLIYEDGLPVTTKENKKYHGFGLKSIKYMVKKRGGIVNISEEAGCFSLMLLIPVPQTT